MKKVILMFIAIVALTSCDCCYCPVCGEWGDDCTCDRNYVKYTSCGHNNGCNDYFCAETLLGTWQCDYYTVIDNKTIKEIKFFSNRLCDITYSEGKDPDWFTDTYTYSYVGGYIKFTRNGRTYALKVDRFIFPELYLRDSFGEYTWRKVRSYGCGY